MYICPLIENTPYFPLQNDGSIRPMRSKNKGRAYALPYIIIYNSISALEARFTGEIDTQTLEGLFVNRRQDHGRMHFAAAESV